METLPVVEEAVLRLSPLAQLGHPAHICSGHGDTDKIHFRRQDFVMRKHHRRRPSECNGDGNRETLYAGRYVGPIHLLTGQDDRHSLGLAYRERRTGIGVVGHVQCLLRRVTTRDRTTSGELQHFPEDCYGRARVALSMGVDERAMDCEEYTDTSFVLLHVFFDGLRASCAHCSRRHDRLRQHFYRVARYRRVEQHHPRFSIIKYVGYLRHEERDVEATGLCGLRSA